MRRLSNAVVGALIAAFAMFSCNEKKGTEGGVPENIQTAFRQEFPDAVNVKWEKDTEDTEWEAEFIMSGSKHSVRYTPEGKWFETEYEIVPSKIPESIKSGIASKYPEYKIVRAEVVSTVSGNQYEIKLNKEHENIGVYYTEDGTFLKQEKED